MLLSIDKLKLANSNKVRLSEASLEEFIRNTCDYFENLNLDSEKINPYDAVDVVSALAAFQEYFESIAVWERLALNALNALQNGIKRSLFDKIASFSGITHIAFAINDLAFIAPKVAPFLNGINELLLKNLTAYLSISKVDGFYSEGNFEVIKGLSGPLSYLLTFNNNAHIEDVVDQIIDVLVKRSCDISILNHKVLGWHYYPSAIEKEFMTEIPENGVVNYGLSHGMAGPLVVLSMAYNKGVRKEGLIEAIKKLISEYMEAHYYINDIAYWPSRITFEQYVGLESRYKSQTQMSWCYGSIAILRSLYISGVLISDNKTEQFALKELLKIAEMNLSDYMLNQIIVCHGLAGTAAIVNAMYLDTGIRQFLDRAVEMIEICAKTNIKQFFEDENRFALEYNVTSRARLHNHLEGYNGVLQTTLSILKGIYTRNDKRLLIVT